MDNREHILHHILRMTLNLSNKITKLQTPPIKSRLECRKWAKAFKVKVTIHRNHRKVRQIIPSHTCRQSEIKNIYTSNYQITNIL